MREKSKIMKKIQNSAFYCIPLLMLFFSIITVFGNTIWVDEAFSLELAKHSMIDLIKIDSLDVHPPLYYMILRVGYFIFGGFWDYIWIGRFMSLIPYIILLLIGFFAVRKQFGCTVAFLFNIFIVGMPQMLNYSTEIRMYSWGMLFVLCAFLQMSKIIKENEDNKKVFCLLAVFSALASYTHYFACAAAIVIYAELFLISILRKKYDRIKYIIISGLGVVVLYLPWLFVFIRQASAVKEDYWIPPVSLRTIRGNIIFLFETRNFIEIVILILVIFAFVEAVKLFLQKENDVAICGIGVWAGTIILGAVLSLLIRPIFVSRYVMGASACFWFGVAVALSETEISKIKYFIIAISSFACITVSIFYVKDEIHNEEQFNQTYQVLNNIINDETKIISDSNHIQRVVSYYFPQNESIVVGDDLTELTVKVYATCNLKRVDTVNDLNTDSLSDVLLLDQYNEMSEELKSKVKAFDHLGKYQIGWYKFDVYYIE